MCLCRLFSSSCVRMIGYDEPTPETSTKSGCWLMTSLAKWSASFSALAMDLIDLTAFALPSVRSFSSDFSK